LVGPATEPELGEHSWHEFVASREDALPFHHQRWSGLRCEVYGFGPFTFVLPNEDGRVRYGIPELDASMRFGKRHWISLPFTDSCPPFVDDADAHVLATSLELA
jgi:hypothetical protein